MRFLALAVLAPALFAPRAGWHAGHNAVHACPGVAATRCQQVSSWAATIPWRGCGDCLPHQMIARLPRDGIILQITLSIQRPEPALRALSWPPRVTSHSVGAGFEGIPARYGVFQLYGASGRCEAYVWAFFGRAHPTASQISRANAELRSLRQHC